MTNTTATQLADLDAAIAKATENIARAARLGLRTFAQQTRGERRRMVAKRDALLEAAAW